MIVKRFFLLLPLLAICCLFSITCALPSTSHLSLPLPNTTATTTTDRSLSIPNMTTPLHAGRSIECFAPGTPRTESVTVEDCEWVFDAILRDPAGAMATHKFSHQPKQNEFGVPALWAVGGCAIVLTSGNNTATDSFRLADVIVKAMEVIDICPGKSKTHLGGIALIGHKQTFFVAVNGPEDLDDPELVGFGGRRNGTGSVLAQ